MSGFMIFTGCCAIVAGLSVYPNRGIAVVFVAVVLALFVRDLVRAGAEDPAKLKEAREASDSR